MTGKHDKERRLLLVYYVGIVKYHLDPYTPVQKSKTFSFSLDYSKISMPFTFVERIEKSMRQRIVIGREKVGLQGPMQQKV